MDSLANINMGQMNNVMWFIDTMSIVRTLNLRYINHIEINNINNIVGALIRCSNDVDEEMPSSYNGDYAVGMWQDEMTNMKKFKKLYCDWSMVEIKHGAALESIIEDFVDRYEGIYSHIEIDEEANELVNQEVCYKEIKVALSENGIRLYKEQSVDGEYKRGYYSDDTFYRIKIKDEVIKKYYNHFKYNEDAIKILKYYIQKSVYTLSSHGLILGLNLYDGVDYVDVLVSSNYQASRSNIYETYYHKEDSKSIVSSYMLKEIVKLKVKEI